MRFDWTPACTRAFQAAQLLACRLGAREVTPGHLLYGLLAEDEGKAPTLLAGAGLDLARARQQLTDRPAEGPGHPAGTFLPFSAAVQAILDDSRDLLRGDLVDRTVHSEAVLLALLRADAGLRQSLEALGLDIARLEKATETAQAATMDLEEPLRLGDTVEEMSIARIVDAAGNRAREALRVIEDYCRFVLESEFLTRECKGLRHDLAGALAAAGLGRDALLGARDTLHDVGTGLATPQEAHRHSLRAVVEANVKRLQEAMRSLEEFGKVHSPDLGRAVEAVRYRAYTLEKALALGNTARQRLAEAKLYVLVTGSQCKAALDWTIQEAAAGGAEVIQLREKNQDDRTLLELARQVRRWTRDLGVLFILNDRPDIARLADADGVHLGQDDLPVQEARRVLGADALIGISTHNLDQVRQALREGVSYLGVGPAFPSRTKQFTEFPGLEFVRQVAAETTLPAFVLGGVTPENVGAAVAAGARRVAVSATVCQANEPRLVAAALRRALE
jgi:thiamine-phosphate pyrophosphorylase